MEVKPIELAIANGFTLKHHRHHLPVYRAKWNIGCYKDEKLIGIATCGRPVSRYLDDGLTLEIRRVTTNGTKNACSKLYSACARIAKEMGYNKIITYILMSENGASLKASGFQLEKEGVGGYSWLSNNRKRSIFTVDLFDKKRKYPNELKKRYSKILNRKD